VTTPHQKATRQRPIEQVRRPEPVMDVLLSVVAVGLGLVLPLTKGSDPVPILGTFLLGAALPVAGYLLPPRPRWILLLVLAFAGVFLLVGLASDTYLLYAWLMSLMLGAIVLLRLLYRRQQRSAH
jgi:hypothetical protein